MRRMLVLVLALSIIPVFTAGPAAAGEKLDVKIDTFGIDLEPQGTFTVEGEGAGLLCADGVWESGVAKFWNETDNGFKIRVDRLFTCDDTGATFVLELKGTIIFGEGCAKNCTWKLKQSTGLDPAPKGSGDIVSLPPFGGEDYVGSIKG